MIDVLKQALEALENCRVFVNSRERLRQPEGVDWYEKQITAIKQAIADLEKQEPVAKDQWWVKELEGFWGSADYVVTLDTRRAAKTAIDVVFGNTSPQPRKPLTDEQVKRLWSQALADTEGEHDLPLMVLARYIEQKHGIKE
jgi:hypothetical protein